MTSQSRLTSCFKLVLASGVCSCTVPVPDRDVFRWNQTPCALGALGASRIERSQLHMRKHDCARTPSQSKIDQNPFAVRGSENAISYEMHADVIVVWETSSRFMVQS
jgi:hypothetical protein